MRGRSLSYPNTNVWGMVMDRISYNRHARFKRKRKPLSVGGVIGKEADGVKFHCNNHRATEKLIEICLPEK